MRKVLTPGWIAGHLVTLAAVATMLGLGAWQLSRATAGNMLSWAYTIQWPIFAGFAVMLWWREVRRAIRGEPARTTLPEPPPPAAQRTTAPVSEDDLADDPELAAYNRFLAWLSANPDKRPVDYPG
ncbi:MAG TPA: hypothetical protein VIL37_04075 [Natronosporangium sp.]